MAVIKLKQGKSRSRKNKGGRPTKMTPAVVGKLEYAFSMGCSDREACIHAGINKDTLYEYQKVNPEFTDRKELLKAKQILTARKSVIEHMKKDGNLALKFLERVCKEEFSLRTELTSKGGRLLNPYEKMTDEELDAELKKRGISIESDGSA